MANLAGFLKPAYTEKTATYTNISDRFIDEEGKPLAFILKTLPHSKMKSIANRSRKQKGKNEGEIDQSLFISRCIVEACVQPDFKDRDLCLAYDTEDPYELPEKMLLSAEYEKLANAFLELNGSNGEALDVMSVTKN